MRIAVFAKAPVAGRVKTRLVPLIGAHGAASLHEALVRHAIDIAVRSRVGAVELWCAPDSRHPFFARCAAEFGVELRVQRGADLGARMHEAFRLALDQNASLVLIGADCPGLTPAVLQAAARELSSHEAVIAPAEDGGYVLVGLSRLLPMIFEGMVWGASGVMAETRARLAAAAVRLKELETFWDIDRPEDYARLQREGLLREALC